MQILIAWILSLRMLCQKLDLSVHECLDIWRNRPAIVVVLEEREHVREALVGRINEMYPF